MGQFVDRILDEPFLKSARKRAGEQRPITRTPGSNIGHLVGLIGEMVFVDWLWGDWRLHDPASTHGKADVAGCIEVKCSAYPVAEACRMLCRDDYMEKRQPEFYVQVIIDTRSKTDEEIPPGILARIAGWTDHATFSAAPKERLEGKDGRPLDYLTYVLPKVQWRPMSAFPRSSFPVPRKRNPLEALPSWIR